MTNVLPTIVVAVPNTAFNELDKCPVTSYSISPIFPIYRVAPLVIVVPIFRRIKFVHMVNSIVCVVNKLTDVSIICDIVHEFNPQRFIL